MFRVLDTGIGSTRAEWLARPALFRSVRHWSDVGAYSNNASHLSSESKQLALSITHVAASKHLLAILRREDETALKSQEEFEVGDVVADKYLRIRDLL